MPFFHETLFKLDTDGSTPLQKYTNQLQLVGLYIISGCEGPTEKLSSFVCKLLQPIAQQQKSYLKDLTAFINFIEKIKTSTSSSSLLHTHCRGLAVF